MDRGRLITIEGLDGAGKTTLAEGLAHALRAHGARLDLLREPGGVACAERIRALVKDPELQVGARAEALLYAAARAQLLEERVIPLLESGRWVLLDRYVDSSLAYQGAGRNLGIEPVHGINEFATGGLAADRTLLLRIDPVLGGTRRRQRPETPDRLEQEDPTFFATIAAAYERIAAGDPHRVKVIDARRPREDVLAAALDAVRDLLGQAERADSVGERTAP